MLLDWTRQLTIPYYRIQPNLTLLNTTLQDFTLPRLTKLDPTVPNSPEPYVTKRHLTIHYGTTSHCTSYYLPFFC